MSYLALARKWRPLKFNQVVGQSHVLTALENALAQNRLHHAYLFSGTRGVGKTSIARLFAKGLNCESGITATPCGECATCREIDEGRFVDLMEIDAASRTKVEDTRDLLDNVQYKPARGRFKVYLIDEVHMLSRNSFNALLKTLEEPPEYVKFLLATTDPQKLPVTILSRCLQFHLKPITVDDIHQQLDHILAHENVTSSARGLGMIAHAADGSMRDALSLTDQAIALGNGAIQDELVSHMLGTLDTDQALHLLDAISHSAAQQAMEAVQQLAQNGVDWDGLLQELANQLHRIALFQALPATLDKEQPDAVKIERLSQALSPQDVQLYYQIALKGRSDLALAPNQRIGLEMIVLRMLAFSPVQSSGLTPVTLPNANTHASVAVQPSANTQPVNQHLAAPQPRSVSPSQPVAHAPSVPHPQPVSQPQSVITPKASLDAQVSQVAPPIGSTSAPENPMPGNAPAPVEPQMAQQGSKPASKPASPIGNLRHQLRSQRNQGAANGKDSAPKKTNATSAPQSVFERVAQKRTNTVSPSVTHSAKENKPAEAYRWQPSSPVVTQKATKNELTPTELKKALQHTKTPEMVQKLVQESLVQDKWTATIHRLDVPKLVEQLALNSVYKLTGSTIELTLRPQQQHLNKDAAQQALLSALNHELGQECHLSVIIGEDGETPLELRERLYQDKLSSAFTSLENDPNVQFMLRRFESELDRDSVRPI